MRGQSFPEVNTPTVHSRPDAHGAKGVAAFLRFDASGGSTAADHVPTSVHGVPRGVGLQERPLDCQRAPTVWAWLVNSPISGMRMFTTSPAAKAASSGTMMPVPVSSTVPAGVWLERRKYSIRLSNLRC